ncbi:hypothetical protein Tco_1180041 [Tanacetum coccineum]
MAIETPLSSSTGTMWCLYDLTPSDWCKTDVHSTDFGPRIQINILRIFLKIMGSLDLNAENRERTRLEVSNPITKYVNAISLVRIENDKGTKSDTVVDKNIVESIELVDNEEAMDEETDNDYNGSMNEDSTRWGKYVDRLMEMPRAGNCKIRFVRTLKHPSKIEERIKGDLDPIISTNHVNRRILEWEERIKNHQEKEMGLNKWRSKVFDNKHLIGHNFFIYVFGNEGYDVSDEGVT